MISPPANRRMSRSSSASISAGGRSLVSTICRLAVWSASVSRSSSACISRRWVRNWTSSTSSRSTSRKRLRYASPWPAAIAAWKASTNSSSVRYSTCEAGVDRPGRVAEAHQQVGLAQARAGVDEERVVDRARATRRRPSPR